MSRAIERNFMAHFVPRSIALVKPPVCLERWNFKPRFKRCSNVSLATLRIALWPTLAKTAFNSSPNSVAPIRAAPSNILHFSKNWIQESSPHEHPRTREPATIQTVELAVSSTLRASMIFLKIIGTCTLSTCAI